MTKTFVAAHNQHRHRPANSFLPKFFTDFLESSQGETLIGWETSNYHLQPHLDMIQFCLTHQEAEKGGVIYHTSSLYTTIHLSTRSLRNVPKNCRKLCALFLPPSSVACGHRMGERYQLIIRIWQIIDELWGNEENCILILHWQLFIWRHRALPMHDFGHIKVFAHKQSTKKRPESIIFSRTNAMTQCLCKITENRHLMVARSRVMIWYDIVHFLVFIEHD